MAATTIEESASAAPPSPERVFWRAIVRTGGSLGASRERDRVEWHLVVCEAPYGEESHCSVGRHLIQTVGHPDGHCLVDGVCGRCEDASTASADHLPHASASATPITSVRSKAAGA